MSVSTHSPENTSKSKLQDLLEKYFSEEDIKLLIFKLAEKPYLSEIKEDNFSSNSLRIKNMELIAYVARRKFGLFHLVQVCLEMRNDIDELHTFNFDSPQAQPIRGNSSAAEQIRAHLVNRKGREALNIWDQEKSKLKHQLDSSFYERFHILFNLFLAGEWLQNLPNEEIFLEKIELIIKYWPDEMIGSIVYSQILVDKRQADYKEFSHINHLLENLQEQSYKGYSDLMNFGKIPQNRGKKT